MCCDCSAALRPNVVWFGESLPAYVLAAAEQSAMTCEVFMSVGTSSQVYPAAGLIETALQARVVEINVDQTLLSQRVDWALRGTSAKVVPELLSRAFRF